MEVHQAGQGPGFASDVSIRGFSSDHSTDVALWIDGVPVNEPVNGHAEGCNDWSLIFPETVSDIDVIKGPTSALFGNFALSGVVNVRTTERTSNTTVGATAGSYGRAEASSDELVNLAGLRVYNTARYVGSAALDLAATGR